MEIQMNPKKLYQGMKKVLMCIYRIVEGSNSCVFITWKCYRMHKWNSSYNNDVDYCISVKFHRCHDGSIYEAMQTIVYEVLVKVVFATDTLFFLRYIRKVMPEIDSSLIIVWLITFLLVLSGHQMALKEITAIIIGGSTYYIIQLVFPKSDLYYEALDNFYYKPYLHIAPYFIGILFGWILKSHKFQRPLKLWMVCLGWFLSAIAGLCLMCGLYKSNTWINLTLDSIYHAFSRSLWSLMLCWVIFACKNGYGGIINYILSLPLWQPLSRLSYCAYLIHVLVITVAYGRADVTTHFSYVFL
uniref:Acyltransferase 3 domain-containing protein n=1 Tax=Strigamia maritima TaxID=126957 RepID=T1IWL8_STRMM